MTVLAKEKTNISVDILEEISNTDLADLCYNTEQAIKAGGPPPPHQHARGL